MDNITSAFLYVLSSLIILKCLCSYFLSFSETHCIWLLSFKLLSGAWTPPPRLQTGPIFLTAFLSKEVWLSFLSHKPYDFTLFLKHGNCVSMTVEKNLKSCHSPKELMSDLPCVPIFWLLLLKQRSLNTFDYSTWERGWLRCIRSTWRLMKMSKSQCTLGVILMQCLFVLMYFIAFTTVVVGICPLRSCMLDT